MAYAAPAEFPPVYRPYTSFMAPLSYAVFGTSRHIAIVGWYVYLDNHFLITVQSVYYSTHLVKEICFVYVNR